MKIPVIDMCDCEDCQTCLDLCPSVFRRNELGYIEIIEMAEYPQEEVEECMKNCRTQCISWEEV